MRKFTNCVLITVALVFLLTACASAFDGVREGFILGFGLGVGSTSYEPGREELGIDITGDSESGMGIQTDFKIGYAPSDYVQIYWSSKVAWFSQEVDLLSCHYNNYGILECRKVGSEDYTVAHGIGGLGITFYLQPVAPCFFFTGVIGFSTWAYPFEDDPETWSGFGIAFGGGYEFSPHWSVEANISHGKPGDSAYGVDWYYKATTLKICVVGTAY